MKDGETPKALSRVGRLRNELRWLPKGKRSATWCPLNTLNFKLQALSPITRILKRSKPEGDIQRRLQVNLTLGAQFSQDF